MALADGLESLIGSSKSGGIIAIEDSSTKKPIEPQESQRESPPSTGLTTQDTQKVVTPDEQSYKVLAAEELKNNNYGKAAEYVILRLETDSKNETSRMIAHPGNRIEDLCLKAFEDANRLDLAELVLKKAVQLDKLKRGKWLGAELLNSALLADVYAKEKKVHDAQLLTEYVLNKCDAYPDQSLPNRGGRECSSTIAMLFFVVDSFAKTGQLDAAEGLNNHISAYFKKHLGSKNGEFINVLERAATISKARGNKKNQERNLSDAFKLASWNWGIQSRKSSSLRMQYASILRELGQKNEADRVEAMRPLDTKPPSEEILYGGRIGFHERPPDAYADTAEAALITWLDQNSVLTGEASDATIGTIDRLIEFYLARRQYESAEKLALRKLQTWKDIEGVSSDQQSMCMNQLAEISLLKNDKAKVIAWVSKAEQANVFGRTPNLIRSAAIRLELGDKVAATQLLLNAAKSYYPPTSANVHDQDFAQCAYLLTQVGQMREVDKLTKIFNEKNGPTYRMHQHDWFRKETEPTYELQNGIWIRKTRAIRIAEMEARMQATRLTPSEGQQRIKSASMERLRARLDPDEFKRIEEHDKQIKQIAEGKSRAAEAERVRQEEIEKRLHNYATERIVASQQAEDARRVRALNSLARTTTAAKLKSIQEEIAKKNFDNSEQLISELEGFYKSNGIENKRNSDGSGIAYFEISKSYLKFGNASLATKNLLKGIDTVRDSQSFGRYFDQTVLVALISEYHKSDDYDNATKLMSSIVSKMKTIEKLDKALIAEMEIKQSEVMFEQSRHEKEPDTKLEDDSKNLFNRAIRTLRANSEADSGIAERVLIKHNLILTKPALAALCLDGPIEYHEARKGSSMGGIVDNKYSIHISGPHSISIIGRKDGGQDIVLDGQKFEDKATVCIEKGNLLQTFNALLAAVRSNPNSQSFALLAEYWYIQNDLSSALQACDMALELDKVNYVAAGLRALIRSKLGQQKQADEEAQNLLQAIPVSRTSSEKLTRIFALMASKQYDEATVSLNELIAHAPDNWRFLFYRSQCYRLLNKETPLNVDSNAMKLIEHKFAHDGTEAPASSSP